MVVVVINDAGYFLYLWANCSRCGKSHQNDLRQLKGNNTATDTKEFLKFVLKSVPRS